MPCSCLMSAPLWDLQSLSYQPVKLHKSEIFQVGQELWEYQNWFGCRASKYVTIHIHIYKYNTSLRMCKWYKNCKIKSSRQIKLRHLKRKRSKKRNKSCSRQTDIFLFYEWTKKKYNNNNKWIIYRVWRSVATALTVAQTRKHKLTRAW